MEPFYPLRVYVCDQCLLVQLQEYVSPETIFREYAYFSSYSDSWVDHARVYTDRIIERLQLNRDSCVVEVASNDGYLLDRKSTRLNSSHTVSSYAVFCLKKKTGRVQVEWHE